MDIKGVLNVSRRVNTGLKKVTLEGAYEVNKLSHAWLSLDPNAENREVTLPDATSLDEGWAVVVHHNGTANTLTVKDYLGNTLKTFSGPASVNDTKAYQFVCIDNFDGATPDAGGWKVIELGDPVLQAVKYVATFEVLDWTGPSDGLMEYSIPESTHERGATPIWQVQDENRAKIYCHSEGVNEDGDLTLLVPEDDEFVGSVVIV